MDESLKGQFLIAGRRLRDPNFFKAVVLILEHSESGVMGIVVNRPTSVPVCEALSGHFELPETDDLVYQGGPVEPQGLFILHAAAQFDERAAEVLPGLYVGSNAEAFQDVVRRGADGDVEVTFRVYAGCAGWGPDQLEEELARADWRVVPGNADAVFSDQPYEVWEDQLQHAQDASPVLGGFDGNPELN